MTTALVTARVTPVEATVVSGVPSITVVSTATAGPPGTSAAADPEVIQDIVAAFLVAGANVTLSYNDPANTLTIAATGATLSTEQVQDIVGAMLLDSGTVDLTYDDTAGTITAVVQGLTSANLSDFAEAVRDRVGATLVAGTGVSIVVDDPGDTITITAEVTQAELDAEATARIAADAAKADDTAVVHKAGAETVTGVKTFDADAILAVTRNLRLGGVTGVGGGTDLIAAGDAGTPPGSNPSAGVGLLYLEGGSWKVRTATGTPGAGGRAIIVEGDTRLADQRTPTDASVTTAKLVDNAVTLAKLVDIATARLLGRTTAGSGDPEELTAAQVKTLLAIAAGDVSGLGALATLSAVGSAQITDGSVANADLADMANATVKGRNSAGTGVPQDVTMAQLKTLLALTEADIASLVTDLAAKVPLSTVTTADDLIVATGNAAVTRLGVAASRIIGKKASGGLGALTAAEVKAILAIVKADVSDLTTDDAAATGSLRTLGDGAAQAAQGSKRARVLDEVHADVTVVNTVSETNLCSLTLPGGLVAAGDQLRFVAVCEHLNNSGSSVNYTWRLKFGATTVLATAVTSVGSSGTRVTEVYFADIFIVSASAQRFASLANRSAAAGSGVWAGGSNPLTGYGVATEDTSADKALVLSVQMGTASANADQILHAATLELVKK